MEESVQSHIPVLFCHVPLEGKPFGISEMTEVIVRLVGIMVSMKYPVVSGKPVAFEDKQGSPAIVVIEAHSRSA
jgi:hypothetical protein